MPRAKRPLSGRQGGMQPWLLLVLTGSPAHGYELRMRLEDLGLRADTGTVYRGLQTLEDAGFVSADWHRSDTGPDRRVYEVTADGQRRLDAYARELAERRRLLSRFLRSYRARATGGRA